jgi:hypothetical protein
LRYIVLGVNMPSLSPDEIRAAAETHRDLGPEYQSAVIESFLDRVGREIDARVDARLAAAQQPILQQQQQYQHLAARPHRERAPLALAIVSMALGIPLTALAVTAGRNPTGFAGLLVIWIAIAVINVAYSRRG